LVFDHLVVLQLVLDSKFKHCAFLGINVLIKGRLRNQVGCALVYLFDE
jgi:hypothetical protein